MSKAKKIVSMILAVAMVLSIAPVSVFASALTPTATFKQPKITEVIFTTDTSASSDVIRVAHDDGYFTLGTKIVKATPAGIPAADSGTLLTLPMQAQLLLTLKSFSRLQVLSPMQYLQLQVMAVQAVVSTSYLPVTPQQ